MYLILRAFYFPCASPFLASIPSRVLRAMQRLSSRTDSAAAAAAAAAVAHHSPSRRRFYEEKDQTETATGKGGASTSKEGPDAAVPDVHASHRDARLDADIADAMQTGSAARAEVLHLLARERGMPQAAAGGNGNINGGHSGYVPAFSAASAAADRGISLHDFLQSTGLHAAGQTVSSRVGVSAGGSPGRADQTAAAALSRGAGDLSGAYPFNEVAVETGGRSAGQYAATNGGTISGASFLADAHSAMLAAHAVPDALGDTDRHRIMVRRLLAGIEREDPAALLGVPHEGVRPPGPGVAGGGFGGPSIGHGLAAGDLDTAAFFAGQETAPAALALSGRYDPRSLSGEATLPAGAAAHFLADRASLAQHPVLPGVARGIGTSAGAALGPAALAERDRQMFGRLPAGSDPADRFDAAAGSSTSTVASSFPSGDSVMARLVHAQERAAAMQAIKASLPPAPAPAPVHMQSQALKQPAAGSSNGAATAAAAGKSATGASSDGAPAAPVAGSASASAPADSGSGPGSKAAPQPLRRAPTMASIGRTRSKRGVRFAEGNSSGGGSGPASVTTTDHVVDAIFGGDDEEPQYAGTDSGLAGAHFQVVLTPDAMRQVDAAHKEALAEARSNSTALGRSSVPVPVQAPVQPRLNISFSASVPSSEKPEDYALLPALLEQQLDNAAETYRQYTCIPGLQPMADAAAAAGVADAGARSSSGSSRGASPSRRGRATVVGGRLVVLGDNDGAGGTAIGGGGGLGASSGAGSSATTGNGGGSSGGGGGSSTIPASALRLLTTSFTDAAAKYISSGATSAALEAAAAGHVRAAAVDAERKKTELTRLGFTFAATPAVDPGSALLPLASPLAPAMQPPAATLWQQQQEALRMRQEEQPVAPQARGSSEGAAAGPSPGPGPAGGRIVNYGAAGFAMAGYGGAAGIGTAAGVTPAASASAFGTGSGVHQPPPLVPASGVAPSDAAAPGAASGSISSGGGGGGGGMPGAGPSQAASPRGTGASASASHAILTQPWSPPSARAGPLPMPEPYSGGVTPGWDPREAPAAVRVRANVPWAPSSSGLMVPLATGSSAVATIVQQPLASPLASHAGSAVGGSSYFKGNVAGDAQTSRWAVAAQRAAGRLGSGAAAPAGSSSLRP